MAATTGAGANVFSSLIRLIKRSLFTALIAGLLAGGVTYGLMQKSLQQELQLPEQGMVLNVESGSNLTRIFRQLEAQGVLSSRRLILLYARLKQLTAIHAGEYQLAAGMTAEQLLAKLASGDVIQYQITFPEGLTVREWLALAGQHPKFSDSKALTVADIQQHFGLEHPEGWFFPDTYQFTAADSLIDLLSRAHQQMKNSLEQGWSSRAVGLPYQSAYEALVMASIVEKETGTPSERGQIAGVFVRRLQQGMRLQTDPTVIYGLGDRYQGNITRRHLQEETAYNTYVIKGLPPTPIANPGRAAIHAALNPQAGEALYFVAKGDGRHVFSSTLEEHTRAVKQYQLNRRSDYRSSPKK